MKRVYTIQSLRNLLTRVSGLWQSQHIRIVSLALLLIWMIPICTCAAAEDFYAEYTPKSANSSVFYVDVYSRREITAAVWEINYPESTVSYYSVAAADSTASVRDNAQKGKVTFAFADDSAVSGKLCRVSFKALQTGSVKFVLHMIQAAGSDKKSLSSWSDYTLSIKLGKDDVVSSDALKRSDASSASSSSSSKRGGGKSTLETGEDNDLSLPEFFDLRHGDPTLKWMLLGAGIPVFIGALIWIGILIGKKSKDKNVKAEEKPGEERPEPDEEKDGVSDGSEEDPSPDT